MEAGVQRWAVNINAWSPSESQFATFLDLLPASDRPLVTRFIKFEDKKRALVSRLLQRKLVNLLLDIPHSEIVIERTREGKPYLANKVESSLYPNLNFNVAHHGSYVVLASEPVCLVGVDVMTTHKTPPNGESPGAFFKPFRDSYTAREWETIMSAGPETRPLFDQFYRLWCLKEAYIKAIGIGLGFELQRIEFYYPNGYIWSDVAHVRVDGHELPNWRFSLHKLGADHWVCVARGPPNEAGENYKKALRRKEFDAGVLMASPEKEFSILEISNLIPISSGKDDTKRGL